MALRTATQNGNLSSSATWGGSSFSSGDQIDTGAFAVVIDTSATIGDSRPSRPTTVPTVNVTGGGAGGGSLAAGTYRLTYANVDSGGKISAVSPACSTFTVSAGNIPRATFPSLPSGVSSRNVYLTNTNAPTGSRALYATGNTTTTIDLSSGSWQDGTQTFAGATAEANGFAITVTNSGALTVNPGVTVTCRGAVNQGNGIFTVDLSGSDVVWEFDASAADSPSNTNYGWFEGTANTQTNCRIVTSGTTGRWKLRSNSGGGKGHFLRGIDVGANGAFVDTTFWSVENVDFLRVGEATRDKIVFNPSSTTFTYKLKNCTSDTCGSEFWASNLPSAASLTYTGNTFTNGAYRTILASPTPVRFGVSSTATGTRTVSGCVFDGKPVLRGGAISYSGNYLHIGWDNAGDSTAWTQFDNNFIRLIDSATQATNGDITNCYIIFDPALTQLVTGTATSGAGTTLTDTGKSWTSNQYLSAPGANTYQVHITGGTGSGQRRRIKSNTTNTLTVSPDWGTNPDATSTYEIIQDGNNYHSLAATSATTAQAITGVIFDSDSVDSDGDMIKTFGQAINYTVNNNIVLPNASGVDTVGTLITMFSNTNSGARLTTNHNTICVGLQSGVQISEGGSSQPAGTFAAYKSNIIFSMRAASQFAGGLQCYKVCDSTNSSNPALSAADTLAAADGDYNWGWNLQTGGYAGNGYNYNVSTTPGTHDGSGDPSFVDPSRNLATWNATQGGAATADAGILRIQANPGLISTLLAWVRGGFAPRNASLKDAGHDGVTIGAVEGDFTRTGTTTVTLGAVTSSATGAVAIQGALSATLGAATLSAAGALAITADASVTLGAVSVSAAGVLPIVADLFVSLGAVTLSASGGVPVTVADANITLGAVSLAGAGTLPIQGAAAITLGAVTLSADAGTTKTADASITLGAVTLASTIVAGVRVRTVGFSWNRSTHTFSWSA